MTTRIGLKGGRDAAENLATCSDLSHGIHPVAHLLPFARGARKMHYTEGLDMAVHCSLYLYFAWVGAFAEVGAVACLVVRSIPLSNGRAVLHLTLAATLCIAAGLGVWFAVVSLANAQMAQWNSLPLPANWTDVRRQWERGHAARAAVDLLGFGALAVRCR